MKSSASSHNFMGINKKGQVSIIKTAGNPDGHVILRGGKTRIMTQCALRIVKRVNQSRPLAEFGSRLFAC